MTSRVVDKVWTSIFYVIAAFVISLLIFFFVTVLSKGWGFWQPDFLFGKPSNTQAGEELARNLLTRFICLSLRY